VAGDFVKVFCVVFLLGALVLLAVRVQGFMSAQREAQFHVGD
jgi:hypothetical protein